MEQEWLIFYVFAYIVICIALVIVIIKFDKECKKNRALSEQVLTLEDKVKTMDNDYSDKVLNYIRTFTSQVTVLMYNEFVDSHDIEKVSKAQVEKLIDEICNKVYDSIQFDRILFDELLFTEDFLYMYIVQTVINNVKSLWGKTLEQNQI